MPFDAHKNLAIATVTTATGAAGTTLGVGAGEGARFPAVPFNATVWPFDMAPDPTTAEVVRVTARTTDTLTIVRAQEGTTARAIVVGDLVAATITAKSLTDIESGVNFPQLATAGHLAFTGADPQIHTTTADGADTGYLNISGGGAYGPGRGASLSLVGNEVPTYGGNCSLYAGAVTPGQIRFYTGADLLRGTIHPSGGFSWGGTTDPGAGNLSVQGGRVYLNGSVGPQTNDGADAGSAHLMGGGAAADSTRGASISVHGNEAGLAGSMQIMAGDAAGGGNVYIYTAATQLRGMIHRSGGFSWGGTTDPGAGHLYIESGSLKVGPNPTFTYPGSLQLIFNAAAGQALQIAPVADSPGGSFVAFFNAAGAIQGTISQVNSTTVAYNTTSDARLKTPLQRHTDPSVLRQTIIYDFVWKSDGTKGRGVFAQEAVGVLPVAVSVGTDEIDENGKLTHPWGVDYSKYVPDLITGWQSHESELDQLRTRVAFLEGYAGTSIRHTASAVIYGPPSNLMRRMRTWIAALFPAWITP
jgi:hypothetical protein